LTLDHLILGLSIGLGLCLAHRLWPLIAIALAAIVAWVWVALLVLWKAIGFAVGMAWDWIRD
jgi:hypothetical protein